MQVASTNSVPAIGSPATASTSKASATALAGGFNEFLQLLVTEMQHQDPTKPMDPTQTVSQLASFASVEQAVQTNAKLTSLLDMSTLSQANSFIGKKVTSADGSVSGVVTSVATSASGLVATLANGKTIQLTTGITIG